MWHRLRQFESLLFYLPFLVYAFLFHLPYTTRCRNCKTWLFQWEECNRGFCKKCANEQAVSKAQEFYEETYKRRIVTNVALKGHVYAALRMVGSGKVLDVGCGTGFMLSSLQSPNRQLYGIDISTSAIKIAKASVVEANFYVSDVRNIPFEANTFDWLICIDTLEHIEGNATVKECLRILKPGGKALFSAPNKNGPGDWHTPGHVNAFTFASFTKYIEQVGFEVTSARKMILYVPILTYTATVLSLALKKNIPLAHGLDISVPEPLASIFFIEAHKRSI